MFERDLVAERLELALEAAGSVLDRVALLMPVGSELAEGDFAPDDVRDQLRHIRSYLLNQNDGSPGTTCVYEATGPEAIRAHARASGLPADEITTVANTAIARPDPGLTA